MDHCDGSMEADGGDHDDHETDEKNGGEGQNDGDCHYLQNFGTSCVFVFACVHAHECVRACFVFSVLSVHTILTFRHHTSYI